MPAAMALLIPCFQADAGGQIPLHLLADPECLSEALTDARTLGKMDPVPYSRLGRGEEARDAPPSAAPRGRRLTQWFRRRDTDRLRNAANGKGLPDCTAMTVFPNFRRNLPEGLVIGEGKQSYAIRPCSVVVQDYGCGGAVLKEIRFSFQIRYADGMQGLARYIDRFKGGKRVEQLREYPDKSVVTSSLYRDHQKTHHLYRALMTQIVQGEISLTYYTGPPTARAFAHPGD